VESGLALRFSEARRSRHSEIPLDSGVNTAGLALMGLLSMREFFGQNTPTTLMHVLQDANQAGGALLIWPEELKIACWKT
jgi:hypothetical protein